VKVLNLKKTLNFYENVLGMKILRHEEFDDPCEATCNGPYGNKWSKTMIGYGPEKENFALELVYNYGVKKYKFGNDI
jgi:catechol 2,3-dioxygenase-like lactoylglutathione lyase family enzyme